MKCQFGTSSMYQLTRQEVNNLKSQFVISSLEPLNNQKVMNLEAEIATTSHGGSRQFPYVFTEQGVAMLSSVLNSERAIQVNITIMRAFVKLKELLLTHKDLAEKITELEKKYANHDDKIQLIFEAIKKLLEPVPPLPPESQKPPIGFSRE
ncbi:MAG: ORF6N domain-containing protein [Candidatus Omnitrophota bacterium]